jgi:hypothetical protein
MKTSLILETNVVRIFLVPETENDRNVIAAISKDKYAVQVYSGSLSTSAGGWDKIGSGEEGMIFKMIKNGEMVKNGEIDKKGLPGEKSL